jgi:hypothetical protein
MMAARDSHSRRPASIGRCVAIRHCQRRIRHLPNKVALIEPYSTSLYRARKLKVEGFSALALGRLAAVAQADVDRRGLGS